MYEDDPFSPQKGEAAQGEYPLDPLSKFLQSLKRIPRQPQEGTAFFYRHLIEGEGKNCRSQKRASEPFFHVFYKVIIEFLIFSCLLLQHQNYPQ
jgi:hypothetical protein